MRKKSKYLMILTCGILITGGDEEGSAMREKRAVRDNCPKRPAILKLLVLFLIMSFVAGPVAAAPGWKFHADLQNTGVYDGGGILPNNVQRWVFSPNQVVMSSPAVVNGVVYAGSFDNRLYAVYTSNGTKRWSVLTGGSVISSPAVSDGVVYVGSMDHNFYAVYASNGTVRWSFGTDSPVGSSPAVSDGIVYFAGEDHDVHAIYIVNHTQVWDFETGNNTGSSPAISDGIVFFGSDDKDLYAVYALNGTKFWNFTTGDMISSSPAISNGIVYVGDEDHKCYAVYASNGTEMWNFTTGGKVWSTPAVSDGIVYFGSEDRNLYAVHAWNGTRVWNFTTGDAIISSPAVADGIVYIGSFDRQLYALYTSNGTQFWNFRTGGAVESSPAVMNGVVYVGSDDGRLYAVGNIPDVTGFSPVSGKAGSTVSAIITGSGFSSSALSRVNLTRGSETITATNVLVTGATKITCKFPIPISATTGLWNVTVTNVSTGRSGTRNDVFMVTPGSAPTISSLTPTSGFRNTTVQFSLTGTNYPAGSVVNFTNSTYPGGNLTTVLSSITPTKITGNLTIPNDVPLGKWNVFLTIPDGRNATKTGAFIVKPWPRPTVGSITPTSGYPNTTVSFTLAGTNLQTGSIVNFTNSTYGNITATLDTVSLTKITGTVLFPPEAPTGKWDIIVTTPDGGRSAPKTGAFTVNPWKAPTITSIVPTSGLKNTTVTFTLSGTNFQPYTVVKFKYSPYGVITTIPWTITPTKINGFVTIPGLALVGKYDIEVIVPDGRNATKVGAFTIKDWSTPTVTSIQPINGVHGTTVAFTLSGTNFQPDSQVTFTNATVPAHNMTAAVSSVTLNKIYGSVDIPLNRSGKFGVEVLCPDGKKASKANGFTVT